MSFWWGADVGDVFFKGLTVNTTGAMVALCVTLTVLSILYEGMKVSWDLIVLSPLQKRKVKNKIELDATRTCLSADKSQKIQMS